MGLFRFFAGFAASLIFVASVRAQENPPPLQESALPPASAATETAQGPFVPMMFPVFGDARFQRELIDTFGDERGGGTRKHEGQDMMAPQMAPLLAVFNGVVYFQRSNAPNAHNLLRIVGDNGWTAVYMHLNNDSPKTNDGLGSREYAFAPNLRSGQRVLAGQFVAYVGNSGNAETVGHHLHFELQGPSGAVNAYTSLKRAQRLTSPRWNPPQPDIAPETGEIRLDATVRETNATQNRVSVFCTAWRNAAGKTTLETRPVLKWIRADDKTAFVRQDNNAPVSLADLKPGDNLIILAPAKESAEGLPVRRVLVDFSPERVTTDRNGFVL